MKRVFGLVGVVGLGFLLMTASPARADLVFADSWSNPGFSTATLSAGVGGPYALPVSATGPGSAVVDFNMPKGTDFHALGNTADMWIWFGSVTGSPQILSIGVKEVGAVGFTTETFASVIDSTYSGRIFQVFFSTGIGGVPLPLRDSVDTVRVTFLLTGSDGVVVTALSTPEPTTLALFGLGLLGMGGAFLRRRRRRARA